MAYEQTDVEVEIGGILDRLGSEMQAASKRVRMAPYASIESFLKDAKRVIKQVTIAGDLIQHGNFNTALAMLRVIEVPEISFTDVGEELPRRKRRGFFCRDGKVMTEGKYIYFVEATDLQTVLRKKLKTKVWNVVAKQDDTILGRIGWFARWRGYVFFPYEGMVFEKVCLRDIAAFIEFQNLQHRSKAKTRIPIASIEGAQGCDFPPRHEVSGSPIAGDR